MQWLTKVITDNKNKISTVFAFVMFLYEPLNSYFMNQPFEWKTFIFLLFGSLVSFSIGKYPKNLFTGQNVSMSKEYQIDTKGYATSDDLKDKR